MGERYKIAQKICHIFERSQKWRIYTLFIYEILAQLKEYSASNCALRSILSYNS